ncbi:MAG: GNAT family N-acetyltransferase [Chloroflexi bacterium]|nr:MAG: GNAT family N-acetyltransferase [Chloroflexota bacterium]
MLPDSIGEEEEQERQEISIRQMDIDDVAAVYHLGEHLFTSEELPILYRTWDAYEVADYFTSDPDYCLVAEIGGRVVGFILATTFEKEGTAWKKYGYVSWIGVDEAFQGSNLARRLYARLEDKLEDHGVRMIIADTEGDNEKAIGFFKKMGFSARSQHVWLAKTLQRPGRPAPPKRGARGRLAARLKKAGSKGDAD